MPDRPDDFLVTDGDPPSKREVLRCALQLFVRDGLCETSIRDIAQASGYTNPALYKFFQSKEALALHLFERCYLHLVSALDRSQEPDGGFETNLHALLDAYVRLLDQDLEAVLYVNDTLRVFWPKLPRASRRRSLLRNLRGLVQGGVAEGVVHSDTDLEIALGTLVGAMGQIARMAYFGEIGRPVAAVVPKLEALLRRALLRT